MNRKFVVFAALVAAFAFTSQAAQAHDEASAQSTTTAGVIEAKIAELEAHLETLPKDS